MRYSVSTTSPRARGTCDRCGFIYNHDQLCWQFEWVGPKLQNLRVLVCRECLDVPQEQLRTIIIPADPVPILNPRIEAYVSDNNPMSTIGGNASPAISAGSEIGNLTGGGGVAAAFNGTINKPAWMCASNTISNSSYNNWVGIDWGGDVSGISTPSSLAAPAITHTIPTFTIYAPNDRSFLGSTTTTYLIQGSSVGGNTYSDWTTLATGTTGGTNGEEISGTATGNAYQYHRVAFLGDQVNYVSVAQVQFNVGEIGSIEL